MPRLGLSVLFTYKDTELLEEKTDSRSGLGNGQDISLSNIIKGFFSPRTILIYIYLSSVK